MKDAAWVYGNFMKSVPGFCSCCTSGSVSLVSTATCVKVQYNAAKDTFLYTSPLRPDNVFESLPKNVTFVFSSAYGQWPLLEELRQYRTNELVRWRMHFLSDAIAEIEGLLEVNRDFCKKQMAEKASPALPTNCAVVP